ncbi:hypothetical protein PT2222_20246 [Paraburkholderia tropica]
MPRSAAHARIAVIHFMLVPVSAHSPRFAVSGLHRFVCVHRISERIQILPAHGQGSIEKIGPGFEQTVKAKRESTGHAKRIDTRARTRKGEPARTAGGRINKR